MANRTKTVLTTARRANRALGVMAILSFLGSIVLGFIIGMADGSMNVPVLIVWSGLGLVTAWVLISVGEWIEKVGEALDALTAADNS